MVSKFDLSKLEAAFSADFSSPLYAVLANEYLRRNDVSRAYTVAIIGRENHPDDISGKYILAKIYLLKNNIIKAKELLEEVLQRFPLHLNARRLIIEILKKQSKNNEELGFHVEKLQQYFSEEGTPHIVEGPYPEKQPDNAEKNEEGQEKINENNQSQIKKGKNSKETFTIDKNMATFTVVDILIAQKHFDEALEVLKILKKKGRDQEKIQNKRHEIRQKMSR